MSGLTVLEEQPDASIDNLSLPEGLSSDLDLIIGRQISEDIFQYAGNEDNTSLFFLLLETDPPIHKDEKCIDTAIARGVAGDLQWTYARTSGGTYFPVTLGVRSIAWNRH